MPTPRAIHPMLAMPSCPFDSDRHIFELKWDGTRCIAFIDKKGIWLQNRRLKDITYRYPELWGIRLSRGSMVIDGELVVLKNGVPDFNLLQRREQSGRPERIRLLSKTLPATYIAFDLLYLNGKNLLNIPLVVRRQNLIENLPEELILSEDFKEGKKLFFRALRLGFEGIMAKEKASPYLPGRRSFYWLKIKKTKEVDAVICGYTEGEGSREGLFGSLILGLYDGRVLRYIGRVGSGFDIETISKILSLIKPSERAPFKEPIEIDRRFRWTSPEIVCRVRYQEITKDGLLRAGVFKGLRLDKSPQECDLSQLAGLL